MFISVELLFGKDLTANSREEKEEVTVKKDSAKDKAFIF